MGFFKQREEKPYSEAVGRFRKLLARAKRSRLNEPAAAVLATVDLTGQPSVRTVLLKAVDEFGFVFYTNRRSRKGREIAANPKAALCFFWDPFMEQVLVEGAVREVPKSRADAYWATRPRESQLGAWASLQSSILNSRRTLEKRFAQCKKRFAGRTIPRPPYWTGYLLIPHRIEFWKSKPFRLNERILYERKGTRWTTTLLYP